MDVEFQKRKATRIGQLIIKKWAIYYSDLPWWAKVTQISVIDLQIATIRSHTQEDKKHEHGETKVVTINQ